MMASWPRLARMYGLARGGVICSEKSALSLTGVALLLISVFGTPATASAQAGPLGRYPDRESIEPRCPPGSILLDGRCAAPQVPQQCPPGTVGYFPACRPAVRSACPIGTTGVYPNCRPTLRLPPPLDSPQIVQPQRVTPRILPPPPEVRIR